jgi:hypothetical protein
MGGNIVINRRVGNDIGSFFGSQARVNVSGVSCHSPIPVFRSLEKEASCSPQGVAGLLMCGRPRMKTRLKRLLPLLLIAGLAFAFSFAGGNRVACDGTCFVPPVRH